MTRQHYETSFVDTLDVTRNRDVSLDCACSEEKVYCQSQKRLVMSDSELADMKPTTESNRLKTLLYIRSTQHTDITSSTLELWEVYNTLHWTNVLEYTNPKRGCIRKHV